LDDSPNRLGQFDWPETLELRPPEGDVSPLSQWPLDQHGPFLIADVASNTAVENTQTGQANHNNDSSTGRHQMPICLQSPRLFFPESSSHVAVPPTSGSMDLRLLNTQSSHDRPVLTKTLQTKRSRRSLDSGYGSILTAQQIHVSSNNTTENLTYPDSGFFDTLAESWEPIGADEEAFAERAGTSARSSHFSESRTVDYPFVTY
jgi:hypothetical protein